VLIASVQCICVHAYHIFCAGHGSLFSRLIGYLFFYQDRLHKGVMLFGGNDAVSCVKIKGYVGKCVLSKFHAIESIHIIWILRVCVLEFILVNGYYQEKYMIL